MAHLLLHAFRADGIFYLAGRASFLLHRDEAVLQILLQDNLGAIELDQFERTKTELLCSLYVKFGAIRHYNYFCEQILRAQSLAGHIDVRVADIFCSLWSVPLVRDEPTHFQHEERKQHELQLGEKPLRSDLQQQNVFQNTHPVPVEKLAPLLLQPDQEILV